MKKHLKQKKQLSIKETFGSQLMRVGGRYKCISNNCELLKFIGKEAPIGCLIIVSQCLAYYIELKNGEIRG
jgi:hypothetical protein